MPCIWDEEKSELQAQINECNNLPYFVDVNFSESPKYLLSTIFYYPQHELRTSSGEDSRSQSVQNGKNILLQYLESNDLNSVSFGRLSDMESVFFLRSYYMLHM